MLLVELGNKYFRFFDIRLAEAITLEGQLSNRWVSRKINQYLNKLLNTDIDYVIYGDTDSLMLTLNPLIDKLNFGTFDNEKIIKFLINSVNNKIQPKIDSFCDDLSNYVNSYSNSLSYKIEKICSSGIFTAKKRYALMVYSNEGVVYSEPQLKVTGLQIIQKSTPAIIRKALKKCMLHIMNGEKNELITYVNDYFEEYKKYDVNTIAIAKSVNGIQKYSDSVKLYKKGTPINTRGAILYNTLLRQKNLHTVYEEIKDGDKIRYCYLRLPNPIKEDVIAFPEKLPKELDIAEYVDYNTMFEKTFLQPLTTITDVIGWKIEDEHSIEDFFE